jgi:Ca2+-binding RTX toxin-like protein
MLYDMHQLQQYYGAATITYSGNDVHIPGYNSGTPTGTPYFLESTLWDPSGTDMLSWAGATSGSLIDLRQGMKSVFGTGTTARGVRLAINTDIENAFGGNQRDVIYGNALDNALSGNTGNDVLIPGKGNDFNRGGAGDDTYVFGVGDGFDVLQEQSLGGTDTLAISQLNQFLTLSPNLVTVPFPGMDYLEDDVVFRRISNDLVVDLKLNRGDSQGIVRINNHFATAGDQVETLNFRGTRIDLVDLGSKIVGNNVNHRFQVSAVMGANGLIANVV